jgi:hypothetical protein
VTIFDAKSGKHIEPRKVKLAVRAIEDNGDGHVDCATAGDEGFNPL